MKRDEFIMLALQAILFGRAAPRLAFYPLLDSNFLVTTNAENSERRSEALVLVKAECEAMAASMNTQEAREAAKSAFDAGAEVFRSRPLRISECSE
ncbi:MAG: hypothetical protein WC205_08415 [Opitutaceae bacterium]